MAQGEFISPEAVKGGAPMKPIASWGNNAAMIGCQGYYEYVSGRRAGLDLNAYANRDIGRG